MAGWRASIGACGLIVVSTTAAVAGSPIAELEKLLQQEQASAASISRFQPARRVAAAPTAAEGKTALPWSYATMERDRRVRNAAVDSRAATVAAPPAETSSELSNSIGCVVGGTLGATIAAAAGGTNTINLIGGGVVSAINPVTLYVSMIGVVFVSFCQLGSALAPLYVHLTTPTPTPEPVVGPPETAPPQRQPPPHLDDLPNFRRGVPYQSRESVPLVRAADRPTEWGPAEWIPAERVIEQQPCVQDRRSIRRAMSTLIHGEVIPPRCAGSPI